MVIDRTKYMLTGEFTVLRRVSQGIAAEDAKAGRLQGVKAWMVVDLALNTGLRVGELSALNIEDFNLSRGSLRVTRLKKKHRKPETIALSKELVEHLQEYIAGLDRTEGALFTGKRGRMGRRGLQCIWKQAIRQAGLPEELSIHSARHTAATMALKKTQNLRFVQKMLGHSSPATTANMYADISFEDMQNGLNGLYEE